MRLPAALVVAFCAVPGLAQQWVVLDGPCLAGRAIAYDSRRARAVVFGGEGETWEFEGTTRLHRPATAGPFPRGNHAMVYDQARGQTLLYGGRANNLPLGDTWLWDGSTWQQPFSVLMPPRRSDAAIAYDSARNRVVLFGGQDLGIAVRTDTWEWDGSQWLQLMPATIPGPGGSPQMAFDSARNVTVLVMATGSSLSVFEWNGADWTLRPSATPAPLDRQNYSVSYDPLRQRTVLFGGSTNDLWEWNGAAWHLRLASAPITSINPGMYFDPARGATVIMGEGQGFHTAMWSWNGSTFANLAPDHSPPARINYTLFHDTARNRSVMFGGYVSFVRSDTWEWDGLRWTARAPSTSPPARQSAMACFDPVTATGLLFGGAVDATSFHSDCWRYDGTNWTQLPGPVPTTRTDGAMAWDPVRNEAILFGGWRSGTWLGDTWRWNGTAWAQVPTVAAPSPRFLHAMAFNPLSSRIVLFGGANGFTSANFLNDTWEWDGAQWQRIMPSQTPPPLAGGMIHDPVRAKILLVGANFFSPTPRALHVWEYDGVTWAQVLNTPGTTVEGKELVWNQLRQRPVHFTGGLVRELTAVPAGADPAGNGCGAPPPLLAARTRPRSGENLFGLELSSRPNLPVVFALGFGLGSTPIGNGCTLLVQQPVATPFVLAGGTGSSVLPVPLPPNHALRGLVVHTQAIALDPAAAGGLALSQGLVLTVGD